jgi:hypothetical protein
MIVFMAKMENENGFGVVRNTQWLPGACGLRASSGLAKLYSVETEV